MRDAAADALADMNGTSTDARDASQWQQWWSENQSKTEQQFRADMLARRSARLDQARQRNAELTQELERIINEQYRLTPAGQRGDLLLKLLHSNEPEVRAIAASIVKYEALGNQPPTAALKAQLRDMIGDSSVKVRVAVADALATINDAAAIEPLLAQLAQEPDATVRAKIASALGPINDVRAMPELIAMLEDPALPAARAAADSIKDLGAETRETDPALARRAALQLRATLDQRQRAGNVRFPRRPGRRNGPAPPGGAERYFQAAA